MDKNGGVLAWQEEERKAAREKERYTAVDATKYRKLVLAGNRARNKQSRLNVDLRHESPSSICQGISHFSTRLAPLPRHLARSSLCTQRNKSRQIKKALRYGFPLSLFARDLFLSSSFSIATIILPEYSFLLFHFPFLSFLLPIPFLRRFLSSVSPGETLVVSLESLHFRVAGGCRAMGETTASARVRRGMRVNLPTVPSRPYSFTSS